MNTDNLMSSIREMVRAEVHVQMIATGVLHVDAASQAQVNEQYSRHETAVREGLAELGRLAGSYKPPVKLGDR
jgi:hypothetical protein